jgi:septum site-determining protein MinC
MAFVLRPEPPLAAWMSELDDQIARSPSFFQGRPVILDLIGIGATEPGLTGLVANLRQRGVRIIDIEGFAGVLPGAESWTYSLTGGRNGSTYEVPDDPVAAPAAAEETNLIVEQPVRSGQSIIFPRGDITVLGSVASGAEIMAGGSIHIYGTLRGRAVAGAMGNPRARIFCRRLEAELLAIDGLYRTADAIDPALRGCAVQAWLTGGSTDGAFAIAKLT